LKNSWNYSGGQEELHVE